MEHKDREGQIGTGRDIIFPNSSVAPSNTRDGSRSRPQTQCLVDDGARADQLGDVLAGGIAAVRARSQDCVQFLVEPGRPLGIAREVCQGEADGSLQVENGEGKVSELDSRTAVVSKPANRNVVASSTISLLVTVPLVQKTSSASVTLELVKHRTFLA